MTEEEEPENFDRDNDLMFTMTMDIAMSTTETVDLTEEPDLVTEWEN